MRPWFVEIDHGEILIRDGTDTIAKVESCRAHADLIVKAVAVSDNLEFRMLAWREAALEVNVSLRADRAALLEALTEILDEENTMAHRHQKPGYWDAVGEKS